MPRFVDGFLIPIATKNLAAYKKMAKAASKVWLDHGALRYVEAVGGAAEKMGKEDPKMTFPRAIKTKDGETVVFSYIEYRSRAHRNAVNKKVMADPRLEKMMQGEPPFDWRRMAFGGFEVFVDA